MYVKVVFIKSFTFRFVDDVEDYLKENGASGIDLWDIKICSLLYADDLILISNSKEDLNPSYTKGGGGG